MSILYKAAARQAVLIGIKWKASNGFSWDILKANWFWPLFFPPRRGDFFFKKLKLFFCSFLLKERSKRRSKPSPELCSADTLVLFASVEPRQSIPNLAVKLWRSWQTCWKSSRKHQLSARVIFLHNCFTHLQFNFSIFIFLLIFFSSDAHFFLWEKKARKRA